MAREARRARARPSAKTRARRTHLDGLVFDRDDLTEHDRGVTVQEGDTGQTFALLEGVDDERVHRFEDDFGDFVGLQRHRGLELLTAGFLANLEVERGDLARGATAADETNRGVTRLEFTRNVERLHLRGELLARGEGGVLLVNHDVTSARHVELVETLDVHTDVITRSGGFDALVVHFDGENLTTARVGRGVGREEDNIFTRLDETLLDATGEDITDTLNLVDTRNRETHGGFGVAVGLVNHVVENVQQVVDVELLTSAHVVFAVDAVPPRHLGRLGQQVVTVPARDREDREGLLDVVLLPANLDQHVLHFVANFFVTFLLVASHVAIHLVDTDDQLLDTEQVEKTRVLTRLALDFTSLVVTLLDSNGKVTVSRDHEKRDVSLGGAGNHILDEIAVTRGVDNGVVPLVREELLGGTRNGHTTLTLFLLAIHIERKGERRLTERVGFGAKLFEFALGDTPELKQ
mmetsp:Transcript_2375/g.7858  ORF Transcript_2375/g.7858 Transcript_2375/m.7858 type:complete len:464 (+) Transcript_2375:152-1543(+)